MSRLADYLHAFTEATEFSWVDAIDILLVSFLIYKLLELIRGSRAFQMVVGTLIVVMLYFVSRWARLETVDWLLRNSLAYVGFAIIVLYQAELRKALAHLGKAPLFRFLGPHTSETIDEVVFATTTLARRRTGAIIVIERDIGLRSYIEGGIILDAILTYDLLLSIFNPRTPLHDGAVIVQGNRVAAAACFLPLSINPHLSKELGTRHRAAIGITEDTDAVAIVVSEETGTISYLEDGNILRGMDGDTLRSKLRQVLAPGTARSAQERDTSVREGSTI
ncbi:MAG TPA: diadenylate cyclase CdaA [Vicinamibacteria bacterium]